MLNIEAYTKDYKWTQISKPVAKRLYYSDENIGICPNKYRPTDSPFNLAVIIKKHEDTSFKNILDGFIYYLVKETGTYPHFYRLEELS